MSSRENKRRSFFARGSLALSAFQSSGSSKDDAEPANLLRRRRTASLMTNLSSAIDDESLSPNPAAKDSLSPVVTPLSRSNGSHNSRISYRRSSTFGSLMSLRVPGEDGEPLSATSTRSRALSGTWSPSDDTLRNRQVLHHGEVQTSSSMFRKKKEYMVLTETHLMRFKSHQKAADMFPSCVPSTYLHLQHERGPR